MILTVKAVVLLLEGHQTHQYLCLTVVTMKLSLVIKLISGIVASIVNILPFLTDCDTIMDHMTADERDFSPFPSSEFELLYSSSQPKTCGKLHVHSDITSFLFNINL